MALQENDCLSAELQGKPFQEQVVIARQLMSRRKTKAQLRA
ncbi:hypothetical protein [Shewanella marisflavi]